jgi:hypothetical protein
MVWLKGMACGDRTLTMVGGTGTSCTAIASATAASDQSSNGRLKPKEGSRRQASAQSAVDATRMGRVAQRGMPANARNVAARTSTISARGAATASGRRSF